MPFAGSLVFEKVSAPPSGSVAARRPLRLESSETAKLSVPKAGVLAFPRYTGAEGAQAFATRLVEEAGVMVIPSVAYGSALNAVSEDFLRIGFGRENLDDALGEMGKWLDKQ